MSEGIEKAWELFEFREGDGGYEDAARTLALAVLEEVRECYEAGMETEQDWSGLRARIEALGKEGTE